MKQSIIDVLVIIVCVPILLWIIKAFVIDIIIGTYKESYQGTPEAKARAIIKAAANGIIMILLLILVGMCSYSPDREYDYERDHYDEYRSEPGW